MAADKKTDQGKTETVTPPADGQQNPPADNPPPEAGKGSYRAVSPLRANKKDFAAGDAVTGLSKEQAAELLALGVIEKK